MWGRRDLAPDSMAGGWEGQMSDYAFLIEVKDLQMLLSGVSSGELEDKRRRQ
jgi:hypothetical protein